MRLAIDPHEHIVQVPPPERIAPVLDSPHPDLGRERWTEPIPPEPHRLVADVDTALEQQVVYLSQR